MQITPGQIVADAGEHVLLTGPISGTVTTSDGQTYDVSAPGVVVPEEKVEEVAHLIGLRYATEGHPDEPDGFDYKAPKKFAKYTPHADNDTLKG